MQLHPIHRRCSRVPTKATRRQRPVAMVSSNSIRVLHRLHHRVNLLAIPGSIRRINNHSNYIINRLTKTRLTLSSRGHLAATDTFVASP